jgi:signal transduction histidine kinase
MVTVMTALRAGNAPAGHAAIVAFRAEDLAQQEEAGSTTMEAIEQLAGGIAQQFNDLLTSINGYSELVLSSLPESEPVREDVEEIRRAGERAAALTQQLLVFSRKQPMVARIVDVSETISSMKPMLRMLLDEKIQISTVLDLAGTTVEIDPGWLEQVILNLVVNARDAMPGGGKLTIETAIEDLDGPTARRVAKLPPGKYVVLTVTDTGCGMEPATRARAFEPFYTTKHSKGMGLGLSAVYGVVKQSGGNVVLQSIPGSGASARIYLPHREAAQAQEPRGLFLVRSAGA